MSIRQAESCKGTGHQRSYLQNHSLFDTWLCPLIEEAGSIDHGDPLALGKLDHFQSILYPVLSIRIKCHDVAGAVLARDVVKTRLKRGTLAKVEGVTQHASPGLSARSAPVVAAAIVNADDVRKR